MTVQISKPIGPALSAETMLKRIKNERRRNRLVPVYTEMIAEAQSLCEPLVIHDQFLLDHVHNLSPWARADTFAFILAICTLGSPIEVAIAKRSKKDILAAYVLEEVALAWIVAITRQIHKELRDVEKARGIKVGPAYRPGLGRWPLETQTLLFDRLPAERIGVKLNESLIMMPQKSTSLIMPLRKLND